MSFQQAFAFGRMGENYILRYLQHRRGWSLLPVYEIEMENSDKGPRLLSPDRELIAPDCLVFKQGKVRWVEVKRKTCFTWYRKGERWTTGIDIRCYEHYLEIRRRYGFELWLLFLHLDSMPSAADLRHECPAACPTGLFGGEILALERVESHRYLGKMRMVYWADSKLQRLATTEEVLAASRKPPITEVSGLEARRMSDY